jgi:RNA polymerase sigma-70 factor (ECF subfamily)
MESAGANERIARARAGDCAALADLLAEHAPRLERMVALRMDRGRSTFDASDVVQDALLRATQRIDEWRASDRYPFHVWLRLLAAQALADAERHAGRAKRDAARVRPLEDERHAVSASAAAEWLLSTHTSPTQAARRSELRERVTAALAELDDLDREIIALRQFEQLSNAEAACELGISPDAATKRFVRALQRMRPALRELGLDDEAGT